MFNVGLGEITFILVAALIVLGPKKLPELARGLGKFFRELKRQTDEVRYSVEREFYRMDQDIDAPGFPLPTPPAALPVAEPASPAQPLTIARPPAAFKG